MVCVRVPLLLKRNVGVLFGVLRVSRSDAPFFSLLWFCIVVLSSVSFLLCADTEASGTEVQREDPMFSE
jgi:hypothetical protein